MTFSDIKNDAIARFGGTSSDLTQYPYLGTWINQKYHELNGSQPWKWTEKTIQFTTTQGVQTYTLTTIDPLYRKIDDLRIVTTGFGDRLEKISESEIDRYKPIQTDTTQEGRPVAYFIWNGKVFLDKLPDQTYTLEMRYFAFDNDLSADNDIPNIPTNAMQLLAIYGYAMILATNFMYDQYNRQMAEFMNLYSLLVQAEITDNEDELDEVDTREPTYDVAV